MTHELMHIKDVEVLHGYRVRLLFQNGVWKTVDLEEDLQPAWMDDTTNETIAEHDGSSRWRARRRWGSPVGLRWRRAHGAGAEGVDPADVVGDRVVHQQALPHLGPQHGQGRELGRRHPEVRGILEW